MAHKIEMVGGAYVVIDLDTGKRASGSSDYRQKHFADEFIRKAKETAAPIERARDEEGHFEADDPSTPENEAYVGGKAPKKKKAAPAKKKAVKKKTPAKKKAKK